MRNYLPPDDLDSDRELLIPWGFIFQFTKMPFSPSPMPFRSGDDIHGGQFFPPVRTDGKLISVPESSLHRIMEVVRGGPEYMRLATPAEE